MDMTNKLPEPPKNVSNLSSMQQFVLKATEYNDRFAGRFHSHANMLNAKRVKKSEAKKIINLFSENSLRYLCIDAS